MYAITKIIKVFYIIYLYFKSFSPIQLNKNLKTFNSLCKDYEYNLVQVSKAHFLHSTFVSSFFFKLNFGRVGKV